MKIQPRWKAYRKLTAAEAYLPHDVADIVRPVLPPAVRPAKPRFSTVALEGGSTLITPHPRAWRTVQPAPVKGLAA